MVCGWGSDPADGGVAVCGGTICDRGDPVDGAWLCRQGCGLWVGAWSCGRDLTVVVSGLPRPHSSGAHTGPWGPGPGAKGHQEVAKLLRSPSKAPPPGHTRPTPPLPVPAAAPQRAPPLAHVPLLFPGLTPAPHTQGLQGPRDSGPAPTGSACAQWEAGLRSPAAI